MTEDRVSQAQGRHTRQTIYIRQTHEAQADLAAEGEVEGVLVKGLRGLQERLPASHTHTTSRRVSPLSLPTTHSLLSLHSHYRPLVRGAW